MVQVSQFQRLASPVVGRVILSGFVMLQSYFALWATFEANRDFTASVKWRDDVNTTEVFDFIVVGGGSAGSVLANRLSQNSRVLLLELGGNPHPLTIFGVSQPVMSFPAIALQYYTEPQHGAALGLVDKKVYLPRGIGLGGSSLVNGAMYQRGNPKDYDNWARITGDKAWSFKNVLKYFKKLEDYHGDYPSHKLHSTGGPIGVEKDKVRTLEKEWFQAAREKGYRIKNNQLEQEGFGSTEYTMREGLRCSTFRGYIQPALQRPNLKIYRYSRVIKVHLDKNKHAYGVTYLRHGQRRFVRAAKEIVLSAGAIDTPKILMLSGIGPRAHLNATGLKTRVNLPVGRNLQDHMLTYLGPFFLDNVDTITVSNLAVKAPRIIGDFFSSPRGGQLATGPQSLTAFITTTASNQTLWPDIQIMGMPFGLFPGFGEALKLWANIKPAIIHAYLKDYRHLEVDATWVTIGLQRPKSVGKIKLSSRDVFAPPLIQPNYFSHPDDMKVTVEGMQRVVDIIENSSTFARFNGRLIENLLPGCDNLVPKSAMYFECYVRHITSTTHHPVGTAPMGKNLKKAVVDSRLRVFKTSGLRVVDASIMPKIVNANTNVPTIMVAELGSDFLREYWQLQYVICKWREYTFLYIDCQVCFYKTLM